MEVDLNSCVVGTNFKAITGPYATGEFARGIEFYNSRGGSSLLEYVYPGLAVKSEHFYVAVIAPVVDYFKGGLESS